MQATEIVLPGIGEPESLTVRTRELAIPGPGQAVVRVEATGISFAEQQMRRGKYYDQPAFPFVPGYDLVGVVESVGTGDLGGIQPGQRVAALTKIGGWANRVILDTADLVPVPDGVDPADAETVVVNGVTAWRMLWRKTRVAPGQTIVVLGANGGVGSTLVQLAAHVGIRVIGTASLSAGVPGGAESSAARTSNAASTSQQIRHAPTIKYGFRGGNQASSAQPNHGLSADSPFT
jgi:NADPH:quinone reductase-like Zn-dependent oxidoreductase